MSDTPVETVRVGAWQIAFALAFVHLVSSLDRHLLSLVLSMVKADMALSDTELGFLQGTAYVLPYAAAIIPAGMLVDRHNRSAIIFAALAIWTLGTAACALSETYPQLVAARMLVGLGQAALVPAATSLIADMFGPLRRGKPIALFTSAATFGRGMALFGGGSLLAFIVAAPGWLHGLASWRVLFLVSLVANVAAIVLLSAVREPPRSLVEQGGQALMPILAARWPIYLAYFGSAAATVLIVQVIAAWTPTILVRSFGLSVAQSGMVFGLVVLCVGPAGNVFGGIVLDRLAARGSLAAPARVAAVSLFAAVVAGSAFCLVGSLPAALAALAAATFTLAVATPAGLVAIQQLTPAPLRGRMTGSFILGVTLIALGIGPVLVGWLGEHMFGGSAGLRQAVLAVLCAAGLSGMVSALLALRLEQTAALRR